MLDRKFICNTWFFRTVMLFQTLAGLSFAYRSAFIEPDIIELFGCVMFALVGAMVFFSTFPINRIHHRFSQLKTQLSERPDFSNTLSTESSKGNGIGQLIIWIIAIVMTVACVISNFVIGRIAYLNGDNLNMFLHMILVIIVI